MTPFLSRWILYSDITSTTVTRFSPDNQLSDIPMAQYIINMNASVPASDKFIIHILDSTHMFVQPQVEQMIRSQIAKFREDNTYVKPN
ncbi:hypothetical protein Ahy_A02g009018 isoform E [Arachis hypogaea]|uniref:General transcription and DNA repair factor IIH subunit TFB5 n=1 Tax=Arachis hypogaea TaxID=3818 RepID=A0A445EFP8_ARAHY|nr:hypothetical protein Ahy_A02g009018 isoform E [Arachis hypogaea]